VADKCVLRKDIQFEAVVTSADYDEAGKRWIIKTDHGDTFSTGFFVRCNGIVSAPLVPMFPTQQNFKDKIAYTARWPKGGLELTVYALASSAPVLPASK